MYIPLSSQPGQIDIAVTVDDPASGMIFEQNEQGNNAFDHTINIDGGQANLQPANFQINGGLEGAFQGLDAVRCSVVIRNIGTGLVAPGDNFDYQVLLSNDLTPSTDDFLLRQVDLGSNGLGEGLFPNETITLDWVQGCRIISRATFTFYPKLTAYPLWACKRQACPCVRKIP